MSTALDFVSKNNNHQAQHLRVFVHGYLSGTDAHERMKLMNAIPELSSTEDAVFTFWDSGTVSNLLLSALKDGLNNKPLSKSDYLGVALKSLFSGIKHFNEHKNKTTSLGGEFFTTLNDFTKKYPQVQSISLYGHSLGARLLIEALLNNQTTSLVPIKNLVFMGGARALKINEVDSLVSLISGDIYNFYSTSDKVLLAKPSTEKSIGRYPIQTSQNQQRIYNTQLEIGHTDYWKKLGVVFEGVKNKE